MQDVRRCLQDSSTTIGPAQFDSTKACLSTVFLRTCVRSSLVLTHMRILCIQPACSNTLHSTTLHMNLPVTMGCMQSVVVHKYSSSQNGRFIFTFVNHCLFSSISIVVLRLLQHSPLLTPHEAHVSCWCGVT